jgi:hypothetical protein
MQKQNLQHLYHAIQKLVTSTLGNVLQKWLSVFHVRVSESIQVHKPLHRYCNQLYLCLELLSVVEHIPLIFGYHAEISFCS